MTSPAAPLALFRALLREAKHMNDYNFRSYAIRRVKLGFRENQQLQGCGYCSACCFALCVLCAKRGIFDCCTRVVSLIQLFSTPSYLQYVAKQGRGNCCI